MHLSSFDAAMRPTAAIGLVLEAVSPAGDFTAIEIPGLPRNAIHLPKHDLIVAATTTASLDVNVDLAAMAAEYRLDIVLLRLDTPGVIAANFALGSLPCAVWAETDFALYMDAWSTWLVPAAFGPAVSLTVDGCQLEIVPPYVSLDERGAGVARARRALVRHLVPVEA